MSSTMLIDPIALVSKALSFDVNFSGNIKEQESSIQNQIMTLKGLYLQAKSKPIISPTLNASSNAFSGAAYQITGSISGPCELIELSTGSITKLKNIKAASLVVMKMIYGPSAEFYPTKNVFMYWNDSKHGKLTPENYAKQFIKESIEFMADARSNCF